MASVSTIILNDAALAFVTERHLATLTTLRPDGGLHVVPVGFTWLDGTVRVITSGDSRKARNVASGGPAAVCQVEGGRWLTLSGHAVIRAEAEAVRQAEALYARRYRPPRVNPRRVVLEFEADAVLGSAAFRPA